MKDPQNLIDKTRAHSMGHFGRLQSLKDLPSDRIMLAYIQEAMKLNEEGVKVPKKSAKKKKLTVPSYFLAALKKNKNALKVFENFAPSKQKDYVEWVTEAKQEVTRKQRLATAIEWISEGKSRNWKYEKC